MSIPTLCIRDLPAIFDLGELACSGPRLLIVDHRPAPSAAAESRSPSLNGARGPDTRDNGSNRIADDRPPREGQRKSDPRRGPISAAEDRKSTRLNSSHRTISY